MTDFENFSLLEELFREAIERPRQDREAFLDQRCPNPEIRRRVLELLNQDDDGTTDFLRGPVVGSAPAETALPSAEPGVDANEFGPFQIAEKLGEGGMGVVYVAHQTQPVKRKVALKVLRLDLHGEKEIARLSAERQALAMMDHPGVARLFDAGTTRAGRPWFAMEYIEGIPLDRACKEQLPDLEARLDLFQEICQAVQHAHQKGILHRDLKPSNILVTSRSGRLSPVIIDFGIACALDPAAVCHVPGAARGEIIGTSASMSPEQARGQALDTRADVYSLGAILYTLAAGGPPFSPEVRRAKSPEELSEILTTLDPPSLKERRAEFSDAPKGTRRMIQDLEWIVRKALAKNPADRYGSADELARDLTRSRDSRPIEAAPFCSRDRALRFLSRHRAAVFSAAALLLVSLLGTAFSLWGMFEARHQSGIARLAQTEALEEGRRAEEAKTRAQEESRQAHRVTDFLSRVLAITDPRVSLRADVSVVDVLRYASRNVAENLAGHPDGEALVRRSLGRAFHTLGFVEEAEVQLRRVLEIVSGSSEPSSRKRYEAVLELAELYEDSRHRDGFELRYEAGHLGAVAVAREDPEIGRNLAALWNHIDNGELTEAISSLETLEEVARQKSCTPWVQDVLADSYSGAAQSLVQLSSTRAALPLYRAYLEARRRSEGGSASDLARAIVECVRAFHVLDQYDSSEPLIREAIALWKGFLPDPHPLVLESQSLLGECLARRGEENEARKLLEESYRYLRDHHGPSARRSLDAGIRLANFYERSGATAAARDLQQVLIERIAYAPDWSSSWEPIERLILADLPDLRATVGELLSFLGSVSSPGPSEATRLARSGPRLRRMAERTVELRREVPDDDPRSVYLARQFARGLPYVEEWQLPSLEILIEDALGVLSRHEDRLMAPVADAKTGAARISVWRGDLRRAEQLTREAQELYLRIPGQRPITVQLCRLIRAEALWYGGQFGEAHRLGSLVHSECRASLGSSHWLTALASEFTDSGEGTSVSLAPAPRDPSGSTRGGPTGEEPAE